MSAKEDQYARQADAWTERAYANATAYLAHRADLITTLGPRLEPGDEVLDLACGDGGLGELLVAREPSLSRRRLDSGDGRRGAATPWRARAGGARRPQRVHPAESGRRDDDLPRHLLRHGPARLLRACRRVHREEARLRPESAAIPPGRCRERPPCRGLRPGGAETVLHPTDDCVATASAARAARALERSGPLARLVLRARFTYVVTAFR